MGRRMLFGAPRHRDVSCWGLVPCFLLYSLFGGGAGNTVLTVCIVIFVVVQREPEHPSLLLTFT